MQKIPIHQWEGCYSKSWNGLIVDEAFKHPAKYSRSLIEKIFDHMEASGWIQPGDLIGDCFGGVGLGGVIAAYRKYLWFGMEIEPRFVEFGNKNFQLHKRRWKDAVLGDACLVLGDSRQFAKGINYMSAVVTSPPYAGVSPEAHGSGINIEKNYETYRKSGGGSSFEKFKASMERHSEGYGKTEGQISALKAGSVDAVITSPPFAEVGGNGGAGINKRGYVPAAGRKWTGKKADPVGARTYQGTAGDRCPENIEKLKLGNVDAVITSPPWEANAEGGIKAHKMKFVPDNGKGHYATPAAKARAMTKEEGRIYGTAEGQIGNDKGEDYWQAMSKVYASCFEALKPGGVAAIVIKDYVKNKKRVLLCDDTCRLLEHLGFVMIERIHALLVKETKTADLFEGETTKITEKKSFFRRLHEKKPGAVRIDWEEVLICQKPYETAFA